jgi:hypothetical protein
VRRFSPLLFLLFFSSLLFLASFCIWSAAILAAFVSPLFLFSLVPVFLPCLPWLTSSVFFRVIRVIRGGLFSSSFS